MRRCGGCCGLPKGLHGSKDHGVMLPPPNCGIVPVTPSATALRHCPCHTFMQPLFSHPRPPKPGMRTSGTPGGWWPEASAGSRRSSEPQTLSLGPTATRQMQRGRPFACTAVRLCSALYSSPAICLASDWANRGTGTMACTAAGCGFACSKTRAAVGIAAGTHTVELTRAPARCTNRCLCMRAF